MSEWRVDVLTVAGGGPDCYDMEVGDLRVRVLDAHNPVEAALVGSRMAQQKHGVVAEAVNVRLTDWCAVVNDYFGQDLEPWVDDE